MIYGYAVWTINQMIKFNVKEVAYSDNTHTSSWNTEWYNLDTSSVIYPWSLGVLDFGSSDSL